MRITVALLTKNRLPILQRTLQALALQLQPGDEALVIDTGSTDGTQAWLESAASATHPTLRYVLIPPTPTLDFATARNAAIHNGHGDAVLYLDDDCLPAHGMLGHLRETLDAGYDAVGGLALFPRPFPFPWWWSTEHAWSVGMATRGQAAGHPDHYPTTSCVAIRHALLSRHPFDTSTYTLNADTRYIGSREDADLWKLARRRGDRVTVDPRAIAWHQIPANRLTIPNVRSRFHADGAAAALRCPASDRPGALAHALGDAANSLAEAAWSAIGLPLPPPPAEAGDDAFAPRPPALLDSPTPPWPARATARLAWAYHQWTFAWWLAGPAHAADPAFPSRRWCARHVLTLAAKSTLRLARAWKCEHAGRARRRRARRAATPIPRPQAFLVLAPTYLGDCLLLQPAVNALADAWPQATITVASSYPTFFDQQRPNITSLRFRDAEASGSLPKLARHSDQVFVPYFHHGSPNLWRSALSRRVATFDRDVGFSRPDSDPRLALRVVAKDFHLHETTNLARLLRYAHPTTAATPTVPLSAPRLAPSGQAWQSLVGRNPDFLASSLPYATLQVSSAQAMKQWPPERWAALAARLAAKANLRVAIIPPPDDPMAAAEVAAMACAAGGVPPQSIATISCDPLEELIALLAHARIAIGPCTGPTHLAMALQVPTFTLYGPTTPTRWGAFPGEESRHAYVQSRASTLTPSEHAGLPENHAMIMITIEEAWTRLDEFLARLQSLTPHHYQ